MELLVLTAIITVISTPITGLQSEVNKVYYYDVESYTWTKFEKSVNNGNVFKAQLIIRPITPERLLAKLHKPYYAQIQAQLTKDLPPDLTFQPIENITEPFEIFNYSGGLSLSLPPLSVTHQNLIKGVISALQVTSYSPNQYGYFKRMEADVTGECETLYSVSPMSSEWRRELSNFTLDEDPFEIIKVKNYGSCKNRLAYYYGVPEGAVWKGLASDNEENQFIEHTCETRIIAGLQGTLYKSEVKSSVLVNPLIFGKQKAEVYSTVTLNLNAVEVDNNNMFELGPSKRMEYSLLYTMTPPMSLWSNEQNVIKAQQLLQEITPMLQTPNDMHKTDFLSKFNILIHFVASMTLEQLEEMTGSLQIAKNSDYATKNDNNMWIIYRDAVGHAGTINAFYHIKSWIQNKTIEGWEAVAIIAVLPSVMRHNTDEFIIDFFNFALSLEVKEQRFLHSSALLAATKIIRLQKDNNFIVDTVITRLAEELKQAIEISDSHQTQVYVKVLGNLGHPGILKVFAPYLKGSITVSKYLRTQMITNLKTLANLKDKDVRILLFSILKNTAEPYEVRVAAALNIFLSFPSAEMFQVMARMTNDDPSTQVRAVLANSITFTSKLKNAKFTKLANNAQAVMHIVTKNEYGYRYSANIMTDGNIVDDEVSFFGELSYIASEDNIRPKYLRSVMKTTNIGLREEIQLTLAVSDIQQFMDYQSGYSDRYNDPDPIEDDFKYSAKKIADILNVKHEPDESLEAAFFAEILNQQYLITINESDIDAYKSDMNSYFGRSIFGVETSYTKMLSQKQILVTFPLAMGVPFIFEYSEPVVFTTTIDTNIKIFSQMLNNNIRFTYARNMDGRVGFIDTLGDIIAITGVVNKLQFNIPFLLKSPLTPRDFEMTIHADEENVNLIHFSVWPYTSLQKKDSLKTIFEQSTTKFIERQRKVVSTDLKFGEQTGFALELKGYSYSSDYKNIFNLVGTDILSSAVNFLYQKDVALTKFDLNYIAKDSKNKVISISAFSEQLNNQNIISQIVPELNQTYIEQMTLDTTIRLQEIINQAAEGLSAANVFAGDLCVSFEGRENVVYIITGAWAGSSINNTDRIAVLLKLNNGQSINAISTTRNGRIILTNYEEAFNSIIMNIHDAHIQFENGARINLLAYCKRTGNYAERLSEDPKAKKCLKDMATGNVYQMDCYKMLMKSQAPDVCKGSVNYSNVSLDHLRPIFDIFPTFNPLQIDVDGTLQFEIQRFFYDAYENYQLTTKQGRFNLNGVASIGFSPDLFASFEPVFRHERALNLFTGYQYLPYCAVDGSKVWTFSGRSYNYSLTSSWHVVMLDESCELGKNDLVILMRRPTLTEAEVYISFKTKSRLTLEMEITPTDIKVKTNVMKTSDNPVQYKDSFDNIMLLEYYTNVDDGVKIIKINNAALRLLYDGRRLIVFTNQHRRTTRGICGQSTTQLNDDYKTPYGIVDHPQQYGASFSLEDELGDPYTVELKRQAKLAAYQPVTKFTNIFLPSDDLRTADVQQGNVENIHVE